MACYRHWVHISDLKFLLVSNTSFFFFFLVLIYAEMMLDISYLFCLLRLLIPISLLCVLSYVDFTSLSIFQEHLTLSPNSVSPNKFLCFPLTLQSYEEYLEAHSRLNKTLYQSVRIPSCI